MANVKMIAANENAAGIVRVAAYCRVSSNSEDQLNSYAAQIRAYSELINGTEGWQLVDIYADEGITGTRADKREDFKRLMRDCHAGKIDKVLVKSISRFARNTYDCLSALRELRLLGISVCFEKENIDTETLTDELAVSVFGSLAQQESVSISQNQRWSYKKRMEAGEFITCKRLFGYRIVNGKELEIVEEEAEIVRWVFSSYLDGISSTAITKELNGRGITTTCGKNWRENTVRYMLTNEKYIGDSLAQKKYTVDEFPTRKVRNKGAMPKYYVENTHPPIVERDVFERAQRLLNSRKRDSYQMKEYLLSRKIICGECGCKYKRLVTKNMVTWVCRNHDRNKSNCSQTAITESEVYAAFARVYNTLKASYRDILLPALSQLEALGEATSRNNPEMAEITLSLAKLADQEHVVTQLHARNLLDAEAYIAKCNVLNTGIAELRRKRRELLSKEDDDTIELTKLLIKTIEDGPPHIEGINESLFLDTVDTITAEEDGSLTFNMIGGFHFNERIWRDNR